ncbi:retention module-containing protein [Cellvibrio sp. UBA7661]|uniref:retention module-containing protein n=1 Tax=Cellvibrio sp. UBA7661 TaxID=1946311 RepID=UPI002F35CA94
MSNAVATVAFLQGQAWAKAPDGSLRPLSVGSVLNDDEVLVTAQGAQVQLDFGNGEPVAINGGQEVAMSRDFNADTATTADEAELDGASVDEALTVLEQGGDLLEELEETAAGNSGGGSGSDGGNSFVRLNRILESTDPLAFNYQANSTGAGGDVENDAGASDYINRAPEAIDQSLSGNEDETIAGQIIASDLEGDTLTFTLASAPVNGTVVLDAATGQFIFTPNANYNGSDSFVVTVTDSRGNATTTTISLTIAPVNDAPTTNDINLTTDEDTPVNGQVVAQDIEGDTLTYVVSGQPTSGTVALDPATGGFVYTPNPDFNGSDSFVVTISDGNGGTATSTVRIGVNPVNDAPVSGDQNLTTPEDTPIDGQVTATDVDGDTLAYSVSGQPANGTVVLNPATGEFTYTPNANYNGSDRFVVTISDGNGGTTTSLINIGVTPVNDAPVSSDQNLTTPEDTSISGQVAASDVDGDTLAYTVSGQPANGTVTLNPATGGFIYTPNPNYNGSDSFVATISDGNGGSTTSRINIGVTPVNDAPTASNLNLTTDEDVPVNGAISANDPDGDTLSYSITGSPTSGTVVLNPATGTFTYTPNSGYTGSDSFTVTISDGNGGTTTSLVSIGVAPVNGAPTASNLNLTTDENVPVNGAISANDPDGDTLSYSITGSPTSGTVVLNPATGTFTYTPNSGYTGGDSFVVTINDGNGGTTTSTVTIGVNPVVPVNQAPVAVDDVFTVAEGGTLTVTAANKITLNDTDADGDSLTAILVSGPTNGSLTLNADGTFTYVHNGSETTTDSFTYKVNDGTVDGSVATVTINVTPENDPPVAVDDVFVINEDTPLVISPSQLLVNDTDAENNPLTIVTIQNATNGTLSVVGGNIVFTPTLDYSGPASFRYTISDGKGGFSTATVNITVNSVNDPTVMTPENVSVPEDDFINGNVLTNDKDSDDLLSIQSYEINGVAYLPGATTNISGVGSFLLLSNGDYEFTPDANYHGSVPVISYTTNTGATSTLTITVTPMNDAPVAADDNFSVVQNGALTISPSQLLANDVDIDGNTLSVSTIFSMTNGTVTISGGNIIFTPTPGYTGPASFSYSVSDGKGGFDTAVVNIAVTPPAAVPPATDDVTATGNEDTLITISLSGSDSDGTLAGYVIKSLPANGLLYTDAAMTTLVNSGDLVTGPVYFNPSADWNGNTSFSYAAQDNDGLQDATPATVSITVNPIADPALIGSGSGSVKEDTLAQTTATGTLTISDPDAGEASFNARTNSPGTYGHFSIDASGNWTYTIDNTKPAVQQLKEGETKQDSFSVTSLDGTSKIVTITVVGTNDGPVALDDTASVKQDEVLTLTPVQLLMNDTDLDSDTLTIDSVQGATNGTVNLVGGNVVFTPTAGYHGPASFTYTVSDGKGGTDTATVNVTVAKANTAPDAVDDPAGASAYSVAFGDFSASDLWTNLDSKGMAVNVSGYKANDTAASLYIGTVDGNANTLGIQGTPRGTSLVPDQIEYDIATGKSESLVMTFNGNLNQANFSVSRLFPGENGGEVGVWEAYFNGVLVASDTFRLSGGSEQGSFSINTGNVVFNSIKFKALNTVDGSGDGGDYFLTGFKGTGPATINGSLTVIEGVANTISAVSLLANDSDLDADTLSIVSVQGAVNGTVSLVGGNVVFTPTSGYVGTASFTYTLSDGRGGSDTATVNLLVGRSNQAPTLGDDSSMTKMNTAISIATSALLANDSDADGDAMTLVSVQGATNGTVSLSGSNVVFTPVTGFEGAASFNYTVRDALGATSTATVNVTVGSATAASMVVTKSLVAVAHGTGGTSVKFPIITKLVDTDGSETLSIKVSNVPTGLSFNAGTNLGGGVWQFTEADLPNLTLNLPGSYTTLATNLTVQVTSTEINGGATASVSSVVTLKAAYTTVDITTTESGNYTGSSANEFIQGGNGNNTINAGSGNNVVYGGAGDDNLSAAAGSDVFFGGSGNDTINAGSGSDRISGGSGNDTLKGGDAGESFVDVFVWSLGDQGAAGTPAVDTIQNFSTSAAGSNTSGGDVLDLRDLLQGESVGASNGAGNLANYLHFEISGSDTIIHISHAGGFAADSHSVGGSFTSGAETQQIVLSGVNLQSLYSGATTDQQIITQLLNNNKLITD